MIGQTDETARAPPHEERSKDEHRSGPVTPQFRGRRRSALLFVERSRADEGEAACPLACSDMGLLRFPDPQLADGEIVLRPWTESDIVRVVEADADPAIVRWSHLPEPFDIRAAWRWFLAMPGERARGTALRMLIAAAGSDRMLGAIALRGIDWDDRSRGAWLLGHRVRSRARGRWSSHRLMTGWAFSELRLARVDGVPDLDNDASRRLLERCGFELAGEISDRTPPAVLYTLHARSVIH